MRKNKKRRKRKQEKTRERGRKGSEDKEANVRERGATRQIRTNARTRRHTGMKEK